MSTVASDDAAPSPIMTDPFAAYHRAGRRMTLARVIPASIAALAVAAGLGYLAGAAPAAPPTAGQDSAVQESSATAPAASAASPGPDSAESPDAALPQPATDAPEPSSPPPALAVTGIQQWRIDIDTTGYQAEIDDCLWVRMDLGVHAPVVGAHNYCGGDVVLGMAIGDSVTLSGVGLDGAYSVVSSRDAHAGDNAHVATDGLGGTVILQTCYWGTAGAERLVALAPQ